jgi:hypothetical protein
MILNSLELNTTYQSNEGLQKLESAFSQEIEEQEETITPEIELQHNRLILSKTYAQILQSGGYLGC